MWKMSIYWGLKEIGMVHEQKPASTENSGQNIWAKVKIKVILDKSRKL